MGIAGKTRVVHALLVVALLWPLVQMALALGWGISSWKLAGWGMYATPRFGMLGMEVYGRAASGAGDEQLLNPGPAVRNQATAFLESYRWLGALAPRGRFVRALLAERPDWAGVRIVVSRPVMDARTGMIEMRHAEYAHPRE